MVVKTKTELGRNFFEARAAWKAINNLGVVTKDQSGSTSNTFTRSGTVTFAPYSQDGWREKIRNHRDATTNMVGNRLVIKKSAQYRFSSVVRDFSGNIQRWNGSGELLATAGDVPTVIGGDPNAHALATQRFIKSLEDATHKIRGASVLAEASEAVRMLASPAKALRREVGNLYQTARKRMYRDRNNSVRAMRDVVAGTWLEWNFGVKPLVQDANAAADALNQLKTRELQAVFPVRGSATDEKLVSTSTGSNFTSAVVRPQNVNTIVGAYDGRVVDFQDVIMRGCLTVFCTPGGDVPLASQFGVGFSDIVPAVWEVIPWSWMFDYFFNISSVIDAWGAPLQNVTWANRTVRNGRKHIYHGLRAPLNTKGPGSAYAEYQLSGGEAEVVLQNVTRSSISTADIRVPLRMKLPGHGTQWANLAALASYGTDLSALRRSLPRLPL
jgi:hypothetical protein